MPSFSEGQIEQVWIDNGGNPAAAPMAAAIAMAESGGNPNASSRGGLGLGLWQIDVASGLIPNIDPNGNARQAIALSANGSNWQPWVTFNTGAYQQFLRPGQAPTPGGQTPVPGGQAPAPAPNIPPPAGATAQGPTATSNMLSSAPVGVDLSSNANAALSSQTIGSPITQSSTDQSLANAPVDPTSGLQQTITQAPPPSALQGPNGLSFGGPMGGSGTVRAQQAVQDIMRYLGVPYVWSGSSPAGVDCIGLLRLVGRDLGVNIPQTGNVFTDMAVGGGGVVGQDGNWAATVGQLAPGDILYYGSSGPVMYIGNGMIIPVGSSHGVRLWRSCLEAMTPWLLFYSRKEPDSL